MYTIVEFPINYWVVLVAAAVNMVLGFLWYGPFFGKQWLALINMSPEKMAEMQKQGMGKAMFFMVIGSFVMSFVLAYLVAFTQGYWQIHGVTAGLVVGFWSWLGFIAPVTLGPVLWEGKSWKLWFLNGGYYLVALILMGVILAFGGTGSLAHEPWAHIT